MKMFMQKILMILKWLHFLWAQRIFFSFQVNYDLHMQWHMTTVKSIMQKQQND